MSTCFLRLVLLLSCSSSVFAQSIFPLPVPTRPTNFPLPIPTRPTNTGYVIGAPGVAVSLPGKIQGNVSKLKGTLAIDTAGKTFSIDGQNVAVGLLPTDIVDVTQTGQSVAAVTAVGSVVATGAVSVMGSNSQYQQVDAATLVPTEAASDIVAIEGTDEGRWMALKRTGEVIAWEVERYVIDYSIPGGVAALVPPTPVPEDAKFGVVAIALAGTHYLALKSTGQVIAWGQVAVGMSIPPGMPGNGQIQYADAGTILPPEVSNGVVAISAGPHNGIAIKENGTVVQWGRALSHMPYGTLSDLAAIPSSLAGKNVVSVDADQWSSMSAALTSDGTLYQWGKSNMGGEINTSVLGKMLVSGYVGWNGPIGLSLSDDESFSDLVGFPLDKLAQLVAQKILAHTNNYGLATKPDLLSAVEQAAAQGEEQGIASVQAAPNDYDLYSSTQYEANRITGVAQGKTEVTSNPTAYNLFTESSIMDMNLGSLMLKKGANADSLDLELTIETKDNLATNGWQIAERITRLVSMDGVQRQFLRVRADVPYVAPNVKVLAHPTLGNILTDGGGRVLYFFTPDSPGANPMFSGASWPYVSVPAAPKADAGITATLGSSSFGRTNGPFLTINARPAYTYVGDTTAGQANGHGAGWVWYTIKADGSINQ